MNGRLNSCIVGQECPALILDTVRRTDSGEFQFLYIINFFR